MSLIYKVISFFAFVVVSLSSTASVFESPYVGCTIGGILVPFNTIGERHINLNLPDLANIPVNDTWQIRRKASLNHSFHAGKGVLQDRYYTGLELSLNHARERICASSEGSAHFDLVTVQARFSRLDKLKISLRDWDASADVRQGYLITPDFLLYAKIGVSTNKVIMNLLSTSLVETPIGTYRTDATQKVEKVIYPIRFGIGTDYKIHDNLSLRFDYTYIRYGKFYITGATKSAYEDGTLKSAHHNKIKLQNTVVMLGFNYHFG